MSNDRSTDPFSQIIEYEVDEQAMTVKRLWSFGEYQPELYGSFNCGVDLMPLTKNRMMVSNGADLFDDTDPLNPHVVEITEDGDVVFHLEIADTSMSAYRAGRIDLYHPAP